jgi:hypothetical protein
VHLLLVDRLICPRCGPPFGLVLLADRVVERRVLGGWLGCPNCRDRFPVTEGFGDLRAPPRKELSAVESSVEQPTAEATLVLAALLAVAEGPGHVALIGPVAGHARALASLIPELEVAAVTPALRDEAEEAGVSRMVSGPGLPFHSGSLRAVALSGEGSEALLEEAARAVVPSGRVVLSGASPSAPEKARASGLHVLLHDGHVLVAERLGPRAPSSGVRLPVLGR